jgi:hypothetical protein
MATTSERTRLYYDGAAELIKKAYESGSGIHTESSGDSITVGFTVAKSTLSDNSLKALTSITDVVT